MKTNKNKDKTGVKGLPVAVVKNVMVDVASKLGIPEQPNPLLPRSKSIWTAQLNLEIEVVSDFETPTLHEVVAAVEKYGREEIRHFEIIGVSNKHHKIYLTNS